MRSLRYHQAWMVFGLTLAFFAATVLRSPVNAVSQIWTEETNSTTAAANDDHRLVSFSTTQYSYIVAAFNVVSLVLSAVSGVILDAPRMIRPRFILALCLFIGSSACVATGFARSWPLVAFLTALTGGLNAVTWPIVVKIASGWFLESSMGTVFAIINCSWLFGDSLSKVALTVGLLVALYQPWPVLFYASGGFGFLVMLYVLIFLQDTPAALGYSLERRAKPNAGAEQAKSMTFRQKLGKLFVNPIFWVLCFLYFSVRFTRSTLFFWGSEYLSIRLQIDPNIASVATIFPPIAGGISALTVGFLYDRLALRQRYILIVCCSFLLLLACLGAYLLDQFDMLHGIYAGTGLLCGLQFFIDSVYALPVGVLASKVGGEELGATASGVISGFGMASATGSSFLIGYLSESKNGFHYIYLSLMVAAVMSTVLFIIVAILDVRTQKRKAAKASLQLASVETFFPEEI